MLLVYIACAWIAGIALATQVALPPEVWAWWLVLPAGLLLLFWRDSRLRRVHFLGLVLLLGALRYTTSLPHFDQNTLASLNDRGSLAIAGSVVDPVALHDRVANVRLAVTRVRTENGWRGISGLALLQVPRETDIRYGDEIEVWGEPTTPAEFEDFSYKEYLARQGIHSVIRSYGSVTLLARDRGNPFFTALYAFQAQALKTIYALFPDPAASLLAGILLGVDTGIPAALQDAFSATNTAHIIAISGYNISIIAGILSLFAVRLTGGRTDFGPRRRGLTTLIVVAGLVVYTLLVGATPSVVRAAWMGALSVLAVYFRRQNDALTALALSALVMTAWSPAILYDLSFQLSFLATLGLVLYANRLTDGFEGWLKGRMSGERARQVVGLFGDSFIVTLAAQITSMPLLLFAFHRLSLLGLFANALVLPVQPQVEILGGLATLVGMVVPPLGQVVAWIAWPFLAWTIGIVEWIASLPFAAVDVGRLATPLLGLYYAVLFGITLVDWSRWHIRFSVRPAFALCAAIVICLWTWNLASTLPDGKAHIEFLDAGGPATLVRTPQGAKILIDGGANPSVVLSALGERMPFWDRSLDLVVLTSPDDDHLAGLVPALERYDVKQVIQVQPPDKPSAAYKKWENLLAQKQITPTIAQAGLELELDRGIRLEVLHPPEGEDAASVVTQLHVGSATVLFAEEMAPEEQEALLETGIDTASTVLVASRQLAPEFLETVSPQMVVLFTGTSAHAQPSSDLLATLSGYTLLQTGEQGTIELTVEGAGMRVRTGR